MKTPSCDSSQYYCTYQAKVSDISPLSGYKVSLDGSTTQTLSDQGLYSNGVWTNSDMVAISVLPKAGTTAKSWPDLDLKVQFSQGDDPDPGPTPPPKPSSDSTYFTLDLPQLSKDSDSKVIIVPKDENGATIKDGAGNPIVFSATQSDQQASYYMCADWNAKTIRLQNSSEGCGALTWFSAISAKPTNVSVRLLSTQSDAQQTTVALYGEDQGEFGKTLEVEPMGSQANLQLTAKDDSSDGALKDIAFYNLQYTDKASNASLDFPVSFTLSPEHMLNISVPNSDEGQYKLTQGVAVTGFREATIDDDVINDSHLEPRTITFKEHVVPPQVNIQHGWPENRIAMGSVTDFSNVGRVDDGTNEGLVHRTNVDAVFKYADNDGAGDRGIDPKTVWVPSKVANTATAKTVALAQKLSSVYNHPVVPVLVEYTAQFSGGSDTGVADLTNDQNLKFHYENLLLMARYLQNHPDPKFKQTYGTLVLNPDFLGEVFKDTPFDPKKNKAVFPHVAQQLKAAIDELHKAKMITDAEYQQYSQIPQSLANSSANTLTGFVQSTNWLVNTVAPSVPFGWSLNIWAGDTSGHGWVHDAYNDPSSVMRHVDNSSSSQCNLSQQGVNYNCGEVPFLRSVGAYDNDNAKFNPTFIAFDKYERDTLLSNGPLNPYLYNANDWSVYVQYVGAVSHKLKDVPVMMFQIPGGHMIGKYDQGAGYPEPLDGATAVDYILGNSALANHTMKDGIDLGVPYQQGLSSKLPAVYHFPETNATYIDYLSAMPKVASADNYSANKKGYYDWGQNHINDLRRANVFSILWGGGSTMSMAGPGSNDDGGYLNDLVGKYKTQ